MRYLFISLFVFGCSTSPDRERSTPVAHPEQAATDAGGQIKNSDHVPSVTRTELQEKQAEQAKCTKECIASRQMEARDHTLIEQECAQGCMKKHFIGQVGIKAESDAKLRPARDQKAAPQNTEPGR